MHLLYFSLALIGDATIDLDSTSGNIASRVKTANCRFDEYINAYQG